MKKATYILFILAVSGLTLFLYSKWGLKGSAVLLGFFIALYGVAKYRIYSGEQQVLKKLDTMSSNEIRAALQQMDPEDRAEVSAIRRKALKRRMDELKKRRKSGD